MQDFIVIDVQLYYWHFLMHNLFIINRYYSMKLLFICYFLTKLSYITLL